MTSRLFPVLIFFLLTSSSWAMGSRGEPPAPTAVNHTSLELIAVAVESGEIDADTAMEYRVYSVKAGDLLPEKYRGGRPMKDGTGVLRQARARFPDLRPEVQDRLRPYLFPEGRR